MKKTVMMIAGLVLPAILTGCATETVISQKPGYSSAPSWIRDVGGDENGNRYQVGSAEGDESAMASAVEKCTVKETLSGHISISYRDRSFPEVLPL